MSKPGSHARKREMRDMRARQWEAEAMHSLTVEAMLFGRAYVPVREVRARLDPVLRAHEVREILKLDLSEEVEDGH